MNNAAAAAPQDQFRPDVFALITNRIITALEGGVIPWKQPWSSPYGTPRNYRSGHVYQGINVLLLGLVGAEIPYFLTYRQAQELGGQVRKGEKGMPVVFYSILKKQDSEGKEKKVPLLRYSTVFNVSQIEGIDWKFPQVVERGHTSHEAAEKAVRDYPNGPRLLHQGSEPYYRTSTDTVTVPAPGHFATPEDYYLTLFHELAHSTGHAKRLDRASLTEVAPYGSATYAKEELVAELAAAFLGGAVGLNLTVTEKSTTAYLQNWLAVLRSDKKLIVSAASQGQKAANHILGVVPAYAGDEEQAGG